jgi:hypothetical protein
VQVLVGTLSATAFFLLKLMVAVLGASLTPTWRPRKSPAVARIERVDKEFHKSRARGMLERAASGG